MDRFTAIEQRTPHLTLLKPAGKYFPRDLYEAGGMAALMNELNKHGKIHPGCLTVNGKTIGENIAGREITNEDVIHRVENPINPKGGVSILYGTWPLMVAWSRAPL
jgi:dihydroxy-acid dehydratase